MLSSRLCDFSDTYILVKGTVIVTYTGTTAASNNREKKAIFKNCVLFTDCISEINNTKIGQAKDIDVIVPMYNLIESSGTYSKKFGS